MRNRHPVMLSLYFLFASFMALIFGALPVLSGAGHVWIHTTPPPTTDIVNGMFGYACLLFFWSWVMRLWWKVGISGMPDESIRRHRTRIVILNGFRLFWMILAADAVILAVRTIVWWASWQ